MAKDNLKFWERCAPIYTDLVKKNSKCYAEICKEVSPLLKSDMLVLELACGSGQLTKKLSNRVMEWTASDFSPKMLKQARRRCRNKYTHFDKVDATNIKYESGTFDAVVISNALHIMPDPEKALKEINRVLVPGGILIAPTFVYDKGLGKIRGAIMGVTGLKVYNKWESSELSDFIENYGFIVETQHLIEGKPLDECLIVARKKTAKDAVKNSGKALAGTAKTAVTSAAIAGGAGILVLAKNAMKTPVKILKKTKEEVDDIVPEVEIETEAEVNSEAEGTVETEVE